MWDLQGLSRRAAAGAIEEAAATPTSTEPPSAANAGATSMTGLD